MQTFSQRPESPKSKLDSPSLQSGYDPGAGDLGADSKPGLSRFEGLGPFMVRV